MINKIRGVLVVVWMYIQFIWQSFFNSKNKNIQALSGAIVADSLADLDKKTKCRR